CQELLRVDTTLEIISRTMALATALGDGIPPPAGPIVKAIGGSATVILEMVRLHIKNKEDAKTLVSDIAIAIALIHGEVGTLGPLTSPSFFEAVKKLKNTLQSWPKQRKRDKKLLSYGENIKKLRRISWYAKQLFDIQRQVGQSMRYYALGLHP
ncbi:hypothetical protein BD779DRAFT_1570478, partial [Infundibulicybe gibba]